MIHLVLFQRRIQDLGKGGDGMEGGNRVILVTFKRVFVAGLINKTKGKTEGYRVCQRCGVQMFFTPWIRPCICYNSKL